MEVAIVGGGVAGLVLALTLHQRSIPCTIYELRQTADISNPGAIGLAPNAIRALDKLGLLSQLHSVSWPLRTMDFYNETDNLTTSITIGDTTQYQHPTLRIVRKHLHDVLFSAATTAGITIITGKKFSHITDTTPSSITFAFTDNTTATSTLLIGADGIHSTVRSHLYPTITPIYKGSLTLAAKLNHNPYLIHPTLHSRAHSISITQGTHGSFIAIAQSPSGNELALALDRPYPSQSREEWSALLSDPARQYELFMEDIESWPEPVKLLMRHVVVADMYRSWPFYALPDLESWSGEDGKVVVLGDAAHAIPPSAGQGACMAVEDAWSLGLVLGAVGRDGVPIDGSEFRERIRLWEMKRRERVEMVRVLTTKMGNARLPREVKELMPKGECFGDGEQQDLSWLYGYEYEDKDRVEL